MRAQILAQDGQFPPPGVPLECPTSRVAVGRGGVGTEELCTPPPPILAVWGFLALPLN